MTRYDHHFSYNEIYSCDSADGAQKRIDGWVRSINAPPRAVVTIFNNQCTRVYEVTVTWHWWTKTRVFLASLLLVGMAIVYEAMWVVTVL